jgi:3-isopropylmalate dehydrogenase
MLDYIGEDEISARIRKSVAKVIHDGKIKTYDMLKLPGHQEVLRKGAASTVEMTDEIIASL